MQYISINKKIEEISNNLKDWYYMSSQIEELKSFIVAIVLKRNIQYNR
jgi:hypothetical protein